MGIKYVKEADGYLLKSEDLINVRHKELLYTGGFYEKELEESSKGLHVYFEEGDINLVEYRDELHQLGDEKHLRELISSFMVVVYLVSNGILYEPYRSPLNYIYNKGTKRLQIMGRKDKELRIIDEDFMYWVLEMITFIISEESESVFGEYKIIDYARGLSVDKSKMLSGYLGNRDLEELYDYTIDTTVREELDDYVSIGRVPGDRKPSIQEIMRQIDKEERDRIEQEEYELEKEEELLRLEELRLEEEKEVKEAEKVKKEVKRNRVYTKKEKVLRLDAIDAYRDDLDIGEDRKGVVVKSGYGIVDVLLSLIGFGLFVGSLYIAYLFYTWISF